MCESLEVQTMNMAKSAKKLIEENVFYSNGEKVKVVIADTTIGRVAEAIRYADMVDSKNIGIHLDTYHMNIEENNIGDAIRLVGSRLRHFHTGENNRNVPGRGHLDWDEIFKALKDINYKNDIVSEPFLQMGNEVGYDIRVWRDILENPTEARLDGETKFLLDFTKLMLKKYNIN